MKLNRREFLKASLLGIPAFMLGGESKDEPKVERVKIKIKNLPEPLKGLNIALISDIHSGVFMTREEMEKLADILNNLNPDLILMPGDFVTSDPEEIYPLIEAFKDIKAKYGIFATLGNHEFFRRGQDKIAKAIESIGFRVLRNQSEKVNINGEHFYIVGIDDLRYGADLDRALKNVDRERFKILLSHKPYDFPKFARYQIQLTVSGHTHGGQIVFAKIDDIYIAPASLVSRFISGHYKLGDSHLYVTRGVGVVGIPIRINCPPEITNITLI